MMMSPRIILCGILLLLQLSYEVNAMDCSVGGFIISCPTILDNSNEVFCCTTNIDSRINACCNVEDFLKQNTPILAGILVGVLLLVILCTVCSCCFCSCCWLARRRTHRGTVLYGPLVNINPNVASAVPSQSSAYPVVHVPLTGSQYPCPPPAYEPSDNLPKY